MSFKTLLLQLPFLILTFIITMSEARDLEDSAGAFRQNRILVEFLPHTNSDYSDFSKTLQEANDIVV